MRKKTFLYEASPEFVSTRLKTNPLDSLTFSNIFGTGFDDYKESVKRYRK